MASHFQQELKNESINIQKENQSQFGSLLNNSRKNFVKKVYSILMIQLLITMGFVLLNNFNKAFHEFQYNNSALFFVCLFISLVTLIALCCSPSLCQNFPINMIILGIFTLSQSYMVSSICGLYQPITVLQAAVATTGATCGLTLYAWRTKYDFTQWVHYCYGFFWCFIMIIIWITFVNFFLITGSNILISLYAAIFANIYSIYILIDTQLIMGRKSVKLSMDNYVLGAVLLYTDIIGLFLQLLRLFDRRG